MADKDKLQEDLEAAQELLDTWASDPAEVFQKYGLASKKQDVKVKYANPRVKPTMQGKGTAPGCGRGCIVAVEFEYES
jgi:hypothetical protein